MEPVTQLDWLQSPRYDNGGCPFCDIVRGRAPATVVHTWPESMAIVPLNPVTPGHVLVIPNAHVRDLTEDPAVSAVITQRVIEVTRGILEKVETGVNVIVSIGSEATQSVYHLHVHVVPRKKADGLMLPWSVGHS